MMKVYCLLWVILSFSFPVAAELYYGVELTYNYSNQKFELGEINVVPVGPDNLIQPENVFYTKLTAFNSSTLHRLNFSIQMYDVDYEDTQVSLSFPYFSYAKKLDLYSPSDKLVFTIDLTDYATCNQNSYCDINENKNNCAEDCVAEKSKIYQQAITQKTPTFNKTYTNDSTIPKKKETMDKEPSFLPWSILIVMVLLIISGKILWFIKRKHPPKNNSPPYGQPTTNSYFRPQN